MQTHHHIYIDGKEMAEFAIKNLSRKDRGTMTDKNLTPDNAKTESRTVTIQVLTVGTKQVTQSLFKQLVEDNNIIDGKTGEIDGNPWGWVNLHTADCGTGDHIHVVWEKNGTLRRAYMQPGDFHNSSRYQQLRKQQQVIGACLIYVKTLDEGASWFHPDWPRRYLASVSTIEVTSCGQAISVKNILEEASNTVWKTPQLLEEAQKELKNMQFPEYALEEQKRSIEYKKKWIQDLSDNEQKAKGELKGYFWTIMPKYIDHTKSSSSFTDQTQQALDQVTTRIKEFEQTWRKSYTTLKEQDQLFIAVSGVWK